MEEILEMIGEMNEEEIKAVMRAVEKRYAAAYPEWEVVYIAVPKDPILRQEEIEHMLKFIRRHPFTPRGFPIPFPMEEEPEELLEAEP